MDLEYPLSISSLHPFSPPCTIKTISQNKICISINAFLRFETKTGEKGEGAWDMAAAAAEMCKNKNDNMEAYDERKEKRGEEHKIA